MGCIGASSKLPLVLDVDAAEYRGALEIDSLEVRRGREVRLNRVVGKGSENARGLYLGAPIRGDPDLGAAKDCVDFHGGGITHDVGLAAIDFKAAEHRVELGELEIGAVDFSLSAAENRGFRLPVGCILAPAAPRE